jgi:hypothetical protein
MKSHGLMLRVLVPLLMVYVTTTAACANEFRTWTDTSGKHKREAAFERLEGDIVHLRSKEGRVIQIPIAQLSVADQSFAQLLAANAGDPFIESVQPAKAASTPREVQELVTNEEPDPTDPKLRMVIARGSGTSIEDAKQDAYRQAIRQIVGTFVDSTQLIENDSLIEDRIITLSSAYIEKVGAPLEVVSEDGLVRVKVRTWIRLTNVIETLKANKFELRVDAPSFAAEVQTKADQADNADALMAHVFVNYPSNSIKATLIGKPEVTRVSSSKATIRVSMKVQPHLEQYFAIAQKLEAALDSTAREKGGFASDGKTFSKNDNAASRVRYWKGGGDFLVNERRGFGMVLPQEDLKRLQSERRGDSCDSLTDIEIFNLWSLEESQNISGFQHGKWGRLVPDRSDGVIFLLMTKSNGSGQKTNWRWFVLPKDQARRWFAPACKKLFVTLVLLNDKKEELLEDRFALSRLGWQVLSGPPLTYACAPWFIGDYNGEWYVPSFTYTREIEADTSDVVGLATVECRIQNSDVLDNVRGVSN